MRDSLVIWLKKHTSDARKSLSQFTTGGFLFAAGLMTIILSNQLLPPSLHQELFALVGLVLTVLGGSLALWGYLGISLFKILIYLLDKNDER